MSKRRSLLFIAFCLFCFCVFAGCAPKGENSTNNPTAPATGTEKEKGETGSAGLTGTAGSEEETGSEEERALVARFKRAVGEEKILKVFCEDFDDNGTKEAFIFTGDLEEEDRDRAWHNGMVWLVTDQEIELVQVDCFTHFSFEPKVMTFKGVKMMHVYNEYVSGACSYLYGVEDNKLRTYFDYASGGLVVDDEGQLLIVHDTYDIEYDKEMDSFTGHTWKPYYLYFEKVSEDNTEENRFREYGAIKISREQFCRFAGGEEVLARIEAIDENVEITDILYRENNIININYRINRETGYSQNYVTVKYNDKEVFDYTEGDCGKYETALIPEIATYPEFKEPLRD